MTPHEIIPKKTYFVIWIVLLILTVTTALVAYVDLGVFNIYVALTIAILKSLLVILFFMHVKQSSNLMKVVVAAGFFWFGIMLTLTLTDYLSRYWLPVD